MMNIYRKNHGIHILKILMSRGRYCMEREYYLALAQARIDRADELLLEANWLLDKGALKRHILKV